MWYPDFNEKEAYNELYSKLEFSENVKKNRGIKFFDRNNKVKYEDRGIYQEPYQQFVRKFINRETPYDSLLLAWNMGAGKTSGAISILENFHDLVLQDPGLEKFLVITKNDNLQEVFYDEIMKDPFSPYLSERERKLVAEGGKDVKSIVKKRIKNYYEFINYDAFVNRVLGQKITSKISDMAVRQLTEGKSLEKMDNRIIVIDEVQNVTGNYRYLALMNVLKSSYNTRLVMLSATPIANSVEEMIYISNLLNFKKPHFDFINLVSGTKDKNGVKNLLVKEGDDEMNIDEKGDILSIQLNNFVKNNGILEERETELRRKIYQFTAKGKQLLISSLRGKVSYVPLDPTTFPKRIRIGEPLRARQGSLTISRCYMSEYQEKAYLFAEGKKKAFDAIMSNVATMCYEGKNLEEAIDSKNLANTNLKMSALSKYSTKIHKLLQNIEKSKGPVFIYSNNVAEGGTKLLASILEANGYKKFNKKGSRDGKSFVLFESSMNKEARDEYKKAINSETNKDGSAVKIIIGSQLIAEGVSFLRVRQVHILEPYWNLTRTLQAEARCIRNYSHSSLSPEERNVEVFWYVACSSKADKIFIDEKKYIVCEEKDRVNKEVERLLKQISVDCYNTKQIIKEKGIQADEAYRDYYKDGEMECDYQKCDYKCLFVDEEKIRKNKDISTYNQYTDPQSIKLAKSRIRALFQISTAWSFEDIVKHQFFKNQINQYNIAYALEELISSEENFAISKNEAGRIVYSGSHYRFLPTRSKNKKSEKTISNFFNQSEARTLTTSSQGTSSPELSRTNTAVSKEAISRTNTAVSKEAISRTNTAVSRTNTAVSRTATGESSSSKKSKEDTKPNLKKIELITNFRNKINQDLFGIIENEEFKIMEYKAEQSGRGSNLGRVAKTFKKDILLAIATKLGVPLKSKTVANISDEIKEHLIKEKKILYL